MSEFNAPSLVAPPHFLPQFDSTRCTYCGKCAAACPMGALAIGLQDKTREHWLSRCIGCGLCAVACPQPGAIAMTAAGSYRPPFRNWFSLIAHTVPVVLRRVWTVWRQG